MLIYRMYKSASFFSLDKTKIVILGNMSNTPKNRLQGIDRYLKSYIFKAFCAVEVCLKITNFLVTKIRRFSS